MQTLLLLWDVAIVVQEDVVHLVLAIVVLVVQELAKADVADARERARVHVLIQVSINRI